MSDRKDAKVCIRQGTTEACVSWGFESVGERPIMFELRSSGLTAYSFVSSSSAREMAAALLRAADDEEARAASKGSEASS